MSEQTTPVQEEQQVPTKEELIAFFKDKLKLKKYSLSFKSLTPT